MSLLQPSMPDPQMKLYQRMAALEGRLAAMERKRDTTFTPITINNNNGPWSNTASLPYYGGRLWVVAFADVVYQADGGGQSGPTVGDLLLNGSHLLYLSGTPAGSTNKYGMARPQTMEAAPTPIALAPGNVTVTFTTPTVPAGQFISVTLNALFIEWPQQ